MQALRSHPVSRDGGVAVSNLRQQRNEAVANLLPTWFYVSFIMYLAFLVVEPFTMPAALFYRDLLIRMASTLGMGLASLWIHRHQIRAERAELCAGLLGLYIIAVSVVDYILLDDPYFDLYVQLLLIAVGMVTLSLPTAVTVWSTALICWVGAHFDLGERLIHDQVLLTFAALAVGVHSLFLRRRVSTDTWRSLKKEEHSRAELAQALEAAHQAKALLDAEVAQSSSEVSQALEEIVVNREQRHQLHRNLLHSNRLSALGRMAAGLAHRLNNRLLVLMGTVDCLEVDESDPFEKGMVCEVRSAIERGAKLAAQLLPLTGKQHINPEQVSVESLLEQFSTLLKRTEAPLEIRNRTNGLQVFVDREAWFQIVFNLIKNADQVTSKGESILLSIEEQDQGVVFSVEDKGPGVPREFREKIFEPFFTTRGKTGGTGLGLSIVLGLVEQMGGQLSVSSGKGGGARFSVCFDTVDPVKSVDTPKATRSTESTLKGRSVLVVEDDPKVRNILKRYLQDLGLQVDTAHNGLEGLKKFEEKPASIVITDVVMPSMDGPTMARELWRMDPALKVLFTSGYSDARLKEESLQAGSLEFLAKPYTREALVETLQRVLEKSL